MDTSKNPDILEHFKFNPRENESRFVSMNPSSSHRRFFILSFYFILLILMFKNEGVDAKAIPKVPAGAIADIHSIARSGDLLFRRVEGGGSTFVLMTDPASEFSHVGIVWKSQNETYVIHVVPSASSSDSYVEITPLPEYILPASAVALYRLRNDETKYAQHAAEIAHQLVGKISFDMDFDISTDERQYCTEFVWKTYNRTGVDLIDSQFDTVHFAFLETDQVILVSTLLNSRWLMQVYPQQQPMEEK